ncbi:MULTISPECIES: membrane protein insertase YidC [Microbacterium]|uniref:YidC/Oxa1 family membrane protein insertase n=1 Tax=Microbacterium TaxID=33882 RepID=UPI00146B7837|nr:MULTISPECIES: membrane protein insertase YidC [Microbacterium]
MDLYAFPPIAFLLEAASSGLERLADLLTPLAGDAAAAASVVLVTLVVRALLLPLGIAQAKAEQARSRLAPRLRALQRRYRADPERLRRETMDLYATEGISPLAGCAPMLAQAPVLGLLYALFAVGTIAGHPNTLLAQSLLSVPLGTSLVAALATGAATIPVLAVSGGLVVAIAAVAEITRRAFRVTIAPGADASSPGAGGVGRVAGALQFTTAAVALFVPLAAALYLATTVTWTLAQRLLLRRRYPLTT